MNQYRQFGVGAILGKKKGSVLVGVVDCAAFACYSGVQGEAVHGEVVCVASPVFEDDPALDEFVDAAADGALVLWSISLAVLRSRRKPLSLPIRERM